jgi:ComF family protein
MWLRITNILSFIFPPSEDELCVTCYTKPTFQKMYSLRKVDDTYALSSFKETPIRAAIHLNKFHNHRHAQKLLSVLLETFLENRASGEHALLIPVPLSGTRERERGHNQVTSVVTLCTIDVQRYSFEEKLLKKVRDTKPQTSLDKLERKKSPEGAYTCTKRAHTCVPGAHIILIDDVMTTGATLREARRTLEKLKPASITCVALAH